MAKMVKTTTRTNWNEDIKKNKLFALVYQLKTELSGFEMKNKLLEFENTI